MISIRVIAVAALALLTGACSVLNSTTASPEQLTAVRSGRGGAIVFQLSGTGLCPAANLSFRSTQVPRSYPFIVDGAVGFVPRPVILWVEAGSYRFGNASCFNGTFGSLPALGAWFEDIQVGDGEVVYVGSLNVRNLSQQAWSRFDDPVSRFLLEGPGESTGYYMTYDLGIDSTIREQVARVDPALAEIMVIRPPVRRIDEARFTEFLQQAYTPDTNGVRPTREAANRRLSDLLLQEYGEALLTPRVAPVISGPKTPGA